MNSYLAAFNLQLWIEENKELLRPPLGNRLLYYGDFKVLIVCGPNFRSDYHIQDGEEFFYQLKGDIVLKVVQDGEFYDVSIREGEVFCLPVIERKRNEKELDELRWYCESCHSIIYQETLFCDDLVLDLPPIIEKYYANESLRTCKGCGWIEEPPKYLREMDV
ncbi:3-hydroxyanthranilate 3,4-dioxygenase [Galdieria sulphuraria]|nr:3-hydroxyanthranilate 3,4-dioxygenase [Galdieria sulphuraria]